MLYVPVSFCVVFVLPHLSTALFFCFPASSSPLGLFFKNDWQSQDVVCLSQNDMDVKSFLVFLVFCCFFWEGVPVCLSSVLQIVCILFCLSSTIKQMLGTSLFFGSFFIWRVRNHKVEWCRKSRPTTLINSSRRLDLQLIFLLSGFNLFFSSFCSNHSIMKMTHYRE